mmetsp:Transcript_31778/g.79322  ORF Transcript_31778/g.79322 Transcript_31778/m.79322 type:complete len:217 (+) Transcript_31778:873-1523(+)
MLVVLVAPPRSRHAAPQPVHGHLDRTVDGDVARERVVAALVHQPAASALHHAEHHDARERPAVVDERGACHVHRDHLRDAVDHVARRRLELALDLELLGELGKILEQLRTARLVALAHRARGQRLEHLVRLSRADVELLVRLRGVCAHLKADNLATRVALGERSDVVGAVVDHDLLLVRVDRCIALVDASTWTSRVGVRVTRGHPAQNEPKRRAWS